MSNELQPGKHTLYDPESGETIYLSVPIKRKYHSGGFFMAMQEGFTYLARLGLSGREMQVLMYVMGKLDFENWIRITQSEIAKDLDMKRPHVSRAIKTLSEQGVIHKGPKVGNSWTYRLDPNFGYKGRAKNMKKTQEAIQKAKDRWNMED